MQQGYGVWIPFGHSPDCDLLAEQDDRLIRVQVKTSTLFRNGRWSVAVCTRGGNQSWNRIVKRLEPARFDFLFVVVADWRCWFIPSDEIEARTAIALGGPKYGEFEINPPHPLATNRQVSNHLLVGEAGFEPA